MIRSFACDYETLKRLAEIERDAILNQGDAEMVGACDGREIALRTGLSEIERARAVEAKRAEIFDDALHFAIKLGIAVDCDRLGLSQDDYREAKQLLAKLSQFAKRLK
nr:MAG TPA: hypothetical protein [Caudoviricetes sp.]